MEILQKKPWLKTLIQGAFLIGFGFGFFLFGWAVGTGKITLLNRGIQSENTTLPENLDYSSVEQVYDELRANYDGKLDEQKLLDGLKSGLAQAAGDPYTEYMSKSDAQSFDSELNGSFEGIGAELSKDKDSVVIVSPISGYPAKKAGLKPHDVIMKVDDQPIFNMTLTEVVDKIRGPAGTKVKLTIARGGKQLEFNITREKITIPSVTHSIKDGIGYIHISRFAEDTSQLSRQAAEDLKASGVKGVILDVRGDPGGLLTAAVDVASLWLGPNKTVLEERRDGVVLNTHKSHGKAPLLGIPTVVLIDEGSASASEIVAGALSDNHAATLMGVKSFGKGSVQDLQQISSGGLLKVTIARWYTPNGKNIDKQGITPDKQVALNEKAAKAGKDSQKAAAMAFLLNQ